MEKTTMRDAFFNTLYKMALEDKDIVVVTADMGAPALDQFAANMNGTQYINVGIAEQNAVLIAAGLAMSGKKVFVYAIMPFITLRCYEMIKVDLCLMDLPVTIVGVGAGFSYDESGPTHHCTEDITIMRVLPNMTVLSPSDSVMASMMAKDLCGISHPHYIRLDRQVLPILYKPDRPLSWGFTQLKDGWDILIIATGNMVHTALDVADKLSEYYSIKARVVDLYRIKPMYEGLFISEMDKPNRLATLEEHQLRGGMGSAVLELLADNDVTMPVKRFGINDKYSYVYGGRANIQKAYGLDADTITKKILEWCNE